MIFVFVLVIPDEIILYTGVFNDFSGIKNHKFFLENKNRIKNVYFDNKVIKPMNLKDIKVYFDTIIR